MPRLRTVPSDRPRIRSIVRGRTASWIRLEPMISTRGGGAGQMIIASTASSMPPCESGARAQIQSVRATKTSMRRSTTSAVIAPAGRSLGSRLSVSKLKIDERDLILDSYEREHDQERRVKEAADRPRPPQEHRVIAG